MLEAVAKRFGSETFHWYGYSVGSIPDALQRCYRGYAWGMDSYRKLAASRISLNRHGQISRGETNCLRTYDIPGVGTCMCSDLGTNLGDFYVPGAECVGYHDAEGLLMLLKVLLDGPPEIVDGIAAQGQARCLRDHTYQKRTEVLLKAVQEIP